MELSIKIRYRILLDIIFIVLPSVKPYVVRISKFDDYYDLWGIIVCIGLIFACFLYHRIYLNKTAKFLFLFIMVYILSTLINGYASVLSVISESSRILICPLYLLYNFNDSLRKYNNAIHSIANLYKFFLITDFVSIVLNLKFNIFSSEIFSFLAMDNTAAFIIVPMLTVLFFDDLNYHKKIRKSTIVVYVLSLVGKLLTFSVTAIFSLLTFGLLLILKKYRKEKKQIRNMYFPKKYIIISLLLIVGIVFFNIQYLFFNFIIAIGKDINLGRVRIWKNVISTFFKSPLIGYGSVIPDTFITLVGMVQWDTTCNHPHNGILAVLFYCGILGGFIYCMMLKEAFQKIKRYIYDERIIIIAIGMISFLVLMIADDYMFMPYIYVLIMISSLYGNKIEIITNR